MVRGWELKVGESLFFNLSLFSFASVLFVNMPFIVKMEYPTGEQTIPPSWAKITIGENKKANITNEATLNLNKIK